MLRKILYTIISLVPIVGHSQPLEITIPIYSIYPSPLSMETVSVDTIYPDSDSTNVTVGDLLDSNSSITAVRSGGVGQQTSVFTRGTNSNHTLFMINGSSITDHSTTNGLFDAGIDPVPYSTSIDVYKGSQSTLFGPGAIGGAVNINTATAVTDKAEIGYGSNNWQSISVDKSLSNDGGLYSLRVNQDQSDGYSVVAGGDPDGYEFQSINFDSEHYLKNGILQSTIVYRDAHTELDGAGIDDTDYTSDSKFYFYQLRYQGDGFNFVIDRNQHDREYNNTGELDTYDSQTNHVRFSINQSVNSLDITAGADMSQYSAQFENRGSYNSSVDKSAENLAGFVNWDWIGDSFIINGGVRRDWNSLHTPVSTYRLGTGYIISDDVTLIAGTNTGFKAPTLYEMYGADNFGYTGNPNLREETAQTYEIGVVTDSRDKWSHFSSRSVFFITEINDQITYDNSTYTNDSSGTSMIQGWDFNSTYHVDQTKIKTGVMYVIAQDSSNNQMTRRPNLTANIGVDHYVTSDTKLWYNWQYHGDHRDIHPSTYQVVDREYQHHTDIGFDHLINENAVVSGVISNVTDLTYERPYGYSQPGREISIRFKYFF